MTDIKQYIAEQAANIVNGARRGAYGRPENNFERIATMWMAYFRTKGWTIAEVDTTTDNFGQLRSFDNKLLPRDIAAMMRLMKEARLVETPDHLDSFMDIVGYALCGAEVAGVQMPPPPLTPNGEMLEAITKKFEAYYDPIIEQKDAHILKLQQMLTELQLASSDLGAALSQVAEQEQGVAAGTSP